jgi:hypothetical protein
MKATTLVFFAAALAAVALAASPSARAQISSESSTTITTMPAVPSVTTRTLTTKSMVSPAPAVIVTSPPTVYTYTTTQEPPPPVNATGAQVLGTVAKGNTTIVFEAANDSDVHTRMLNTWDAYAQEHPGVANTLAYKPWLINDPAYLQRHPSLDQFFQQHPNIKVAMNADPGNFSAIPPRPGE